MQEEQKRRERIVDDESQRMRQAEKEHGTTYQLHAMQQILHSPSSGLLGMNEVLTLIWICSTCASVLCLQITYRA